MFSEKDIPRGVASSIGGQTEVNGELLAHLGGFYCNNPKVSDMGAAIVPINKFACPLPTSLEFMCRLVFWTGLTVCWFLMEYDVLGEGIIVVGSALAIISLILWQLIRLQVVKKHYDFKNNDAILITDDNIYIPSYYTKTSQGVTLAKVQVKHIVFDWSYQNIGDKSFDNSVGACMDLKGAQIIDRNSNVYNLPFWQTASYVLISALVSHGYEPSLVKISRAQSGLISGLKYILGNVLMVFVGWAVLALLFST